MSDYNSRGLLDLLVSKEYPQPVGERMRISNNPVSFLAVNYTPTNYQMQIVYLNGKTLMPLSGIVLPANTCVPIVLPGLSDELYGRVWVTFIPNPYTILHPSDMKCPGNLTGLTSFPFSVVKTPDELYFYDLFCTEVAFNVTVY